ncbi:MULTISPECIES: F0F1 ATP synthase subunit epsilon [unclassified Nitrosospira]|uniref:F0F1 ATP synthase subunit epsilon n=1 Tax=unclassified Nitrosospira TaxID=2609267 RepID=UPI000D30EA95|nr:MULTISPECIES: F0F1 ATP synthase subunit epsilon [unclassified Nitrosospira]PTR16615.1 F-type H+-transporting ATPase subunit epsilon [Nitrosospira sp. Nsp2]WON73359.1 F0F1 ATP synthase subunit epsilon [Nitrosospira sp. Is2]
MNLKILLPFRVLTEKSDVMHITVETDAGSLGFLPRRLDCVAALKPGIMTFKAKGEAETYVAIDEGILVKTGQDVLVSVRNAKGGIDLNTLRKAVRDEFLSLNVHEQRMRRMMATMESGFIRRFAEFQRE